MPMPTTAGDYSHRQDIQIAARRGRRKEHLVTMDHVSKSTCKSVVAMSPAVSDDVMYGKEWLCKGVTLP